MKKIYVLLILTINTAAFCQDADLNKGWSLSMAFGTSESISTGLPHKFNLNMFPAIGYVFNRKLKLRFEFQLVKFKNETKNVDDVNIYAARLDFMYGKFEKCGCLQWYVNFGPGVYFLGASNNNSSISDHESDFGVGGGGGLTMGQKKIRGFFEVQYNQVFNDGTVKNYIPFKLGISYTFF